MDPASQPCLIELGNVRITGLNGAELWRLTAEKADELQVGGTALAISRGRIVEILSDGEDPQVLLPVVSAGKRVRLEVSVRVDISIDGMSRAFARYLRALA